MNVDKIINAMKDCMKQLGLDDDMIQNASLSDAGMDALDVVEFVMSIEETLDIEIDDEDIGDGTEITFAEVYQLIEKNS